MDAIDRYLALRADYDKQKGYTKADAILPRATDALVDHVEDELGVTFPPSYRKLVTSTYLQCYEEFLWPTRKKKEAHSFLAPRALLPPFLLAFMISGDGDEVCFDMRDGDHGDEFPIVRWYHDVEYDDPEEVVELERIAANFGEYLVQHSARVLGYRPDPEPPA